MSKELLRKHDISFRVLVLLRVVETKMFKSPPSGILQRQQMPRTSVQTSEAEMQSELHLAHIARAEDLSGSIAEDVAVRVHQVDVIRGVVVFPLELESLGLGQLEYFAQRQI